MPPAVGAHVIGAYNSDAEISIVSLLKGANNAASARLKTDYDLQQGKYYLVFGYNNNGIYTSYGESSVIPLGRWFFTNSIAGKTPDVQIQILLKAGLDNLSQQLQETQEEKHKRVSS